METRRSFFIVMMSPEGVLEASATPTTRTWTTMASRTAPRWSSTFCRKIPVTAPASTATETPPSPWWTSSSVALRRRSSEASSQSTGCT
jgi:hypothetical protein